MEVQEYLERVKKIKEELEYLDSIFPHCNNIRDFQLFNAKSFEKVCKELGIEYKKKKDEYNTIRYEARYKGMSIIALDWL